MTKLEQLWRDLDKADRHAKKLQNQALSANWCDAAWSKKFGEDARSAANAEAQAIRDKIEALREPAE